MSERATLARPYAEAVFGLARDASRHAFWVRALALGTAIVQDQGAGHILRDPRIPSKTLLGLLHDIGGETFDEEVMAFLGLLVENERLLLLPEIARMFGDLCRDAEHSIDVEITSAYVLSPPEEQEIRGRLERRFRRTVVLTTRIDPALVAGAVIRAHDRVIDGSLRARLAALAASLNS
ncbi:MAG: F0F1 ATP synthase subunit delta [Acidiferrobacteraceae bacterium]